MANFRPFSAHNELTTSCAQIFPSLAKVFKINWEDLLTMIFYMVKECHFGAGDILDKFAFYEVLFFWEKFSDDVKKQNERQKKDQEEQEAKMNSMKSNMDHNKMMQNMNQNMSHNMPKMPSAPKMPK